MAEFLQQLVNGIAWGSIYALIALGYTMVYGVLRLINFAHGDVYMVGAYAGLFCAGWLRAGTEPTLGKALLGSDHPVLAICYGCQLLAVVSGGALWQHVPTQVRGAVRHAGTYPDLPRHEITVRAGSRLRGLLGAERVEVNNAHHQAPKRLGDGLVVTATAADGVIEGFEAPGDRFLVGVEWHPDLMPDRPEQRRLFETVVEEAARRVRV